MSGIESFLRFPKSSIGDFGFDALSWGPYGWLANLSGRIAWTRNKQNSKETRRKSQTGRGYRVPNPGRQAGSWDAALRRDRNASPRSWPATKPDGSGEPGRRRGNPTVHRSRLSRLWTILPRRDQQAGSPLDGWPGRARRNGRSLPSLSTVFFSLNVKHSDWTLENPHRDSSGR